MDGKYSKYLQKHEIKNKWKKKKKKEEEIKKKKGKSEKNKQMGVLGVKPLTHGSTPFTLGQWPLDDN